MASILCVGVGITHVQTGHGSMCLADIRNLPGSNTSLDITCHSELAQEVAGTPCVCPCDAPVGW